MFTKEEIELAPKVYEVLKGMGWKWEPKEGDWALTDTGEAVLIYKNMDEKSKENCPFLANTTSSYGITSCIGPEFHEVGIPILHWERIEEILEKRGYDLYVDLNEILELYIPPEGHYAKFLNYRDRSIWAEGVGRTRQEAVMKSVAELGRKIEKNRQKGL